MSFFRSFNGLVWGKICSQPIHWFPEPRDAGGRTALRAYGRQFPAICWSKPMGGTSEMHCQMEVWSCLIHGWSKLDWGSRLDCQSRIKKSGFETSPFFATDVPNFGTCWLFFGFTQTVITLLTYLHTQLTYTHTVICNSTLVCLLSPSRWLYRFLCSFISCPRVNVAIAPNPALIWAVTKTLCWLMLVVYILQNLYLV